MGTTMARDNFSARSSRDDYRDVATMVTKTVFSFRNLGHRRDVAIEKAAAALGMTARRVKAMFYDEIVVVDDVERWNIMRRFSRYLNEESDRVLATAAIMKAEANETLRKSAELRARSAALLAQTDK